jgi:hypothetical protein
MHYVPRILIQFKPSGFCYQAHQLGSYKTMHPQRTFLLQTALLDKPVITIHMHSTSPLPGRQPPSHHEAEMPSFSLVMVKAYPMLEPVLFPTPNERSSRNTPIYASDTSDEDDEDISMVRQILILHKWSLTRYACRIGWVDVIQG